MHLKFILHLFEVPSKIFILTFVNIFIVFSYLLCYTDTKVTSYRNNFAFYANNF